MRKMFAVAPTAPDRCPAISRQFVRLPAGPGSDCYGPTTGRFTSWCGSCAKARRSLGIRALGEIQMSKIILAAIPLMLAGVGVLVWATLTTQARIDVPAGAIMMGARDLPVTHYDDYSLVFSAPGLVGP